MLKRLNISLLEYGWEQNNTFIEVQFRWENIWWNVFLGQQRETGDWLRRQTCAVVCVKFRMLRRALKMNFQQLRCEGIRPNSAHACAHISNDMLLVRNWQRFRQKSYETRTSGHLNISSDDTKLWNLCRYDHVNRSCIPKIMSTNKALSFDGVACTGNSIQTCQANLSDTSAYLLTRHRLSNEFEYFKFNLL